MNKTIFALLIASCISTAPICADQGAHQRAIATAVAALNKGAKKILFSAMAMGFGFGYFTFGYWNAASPDENIASLGRFQMFAGCVPFVGGMLASAHIEQSIYHEMVNEHARFIDQTVEKK
jgi:hypothetical protein